MNFERQIRAAYRRARKQGKLLADKAVHICPNQWNEETFDCSINGAIDWMKQTFISKIDNKEGSLKLSHIGVNGLRQVLIQLERM